MKWKQIKENREGEYIFAGKTEMAGECINVFARLGFSGGHFNWEGNNLIHSKDNGKRIIVGLDHPVWSHCLDVFNHEAFEWAAARLHCRLEITDWWSKTHSDYTFIMTHQQFSEVCLRASICTAPVLGDLIDIYELCQTHKANKKFRA